MFMFISLKLNSIAQDKTRTWVVNVKLQKMAGGRFWDSTNVNLISFHSNHNLRVSWSSQESSVGSTLDWYTERTGFKSCRLQLNFQMEKGCRRGRILWRTAVYAVRHKIRLCRIKFEIMIWYIQSLHCRLHRYVSDTIWNIPQVYLFSPFEKWHTHCKIATCQKQITFFKTFNAVSYVFYTIGEK